MAMKVTMKALVGLVHRSKLRSEWMMGRHGLGVGSTWGGELNDSGLEAGEVVQLQGEKYRVLDGDDGLMIELVRNPVGEKKQARRR